MADPAQQTGKVRRALAALLLAVLIGFSAAAPKPAQAVFGIADTSFDVIVGNVWQAIKDAATFAWQHGAAVAYRNAAHYFANQVAYDTAVWIGSGGQGQQPLFVTEGLGPYLKNLGDATAGEFLDSFARESSQDRTHPGKCDVPVDPDYDGRACYSAQDCGPDAKSKSCVGVTETKGTGFFGQGLCAPLSANVRLNILLPLFQEQRPYPPACTLSKIEQNWSATLANPRQSLLAFNAVLDPRQNDLGVALQLQQNLTQTTAQASEVGALEQTINRGLKSVTEPITKKIKTPIAREERQTTIPVDLSTQDFATVTGDALADTLGTFTNTLASRLMKRLMEGDVPNPSGTFNPGNNPSLALGGVEYATQVASSLKTPQLVLGERIDVISEFSNCPDNQAYADINNCTIDGRFADVLRSAQAGKALTVQEAIDSGAINGGWIFKGDRPLSVRTPDAWYLSDLRKLRRARFIPVGWELAAQKFLGTSVTLQQVIGNEAQNYGTLGGGGFNDTLSPYYHLIDPNWVLKAPVEQCRTQGYGQQLQVEGGTRQQQCVDTQSCVAENADGTCQAWGYCTREKNTWRLGGDSCEFPPGSGYSPYATCQAFTSRAGAQVTYLQNSLTGYDDGTCDASSAGCRWYSTSYSPAAPTAARYNAAARVYLKALDSISCDPANEGCHQFLRLKNVALPSSACSPNDSACLTNDVKNQVVGTPGDTYDQYAEVQTLTLKEAPPYLNCYDSDPTNDSPLCRNYLASCRVDEVGCKLYTPGDGSPGVPGIAGQTCPNECVGFNSYDQLPTPFEPQPYFCQSGPTVGAVCRADADCGGAPGSCAAQPTVNFIPSTAQLCSAQAVGCEEFTNVTNEGKEYYSELKACVTPGHGEHTFYTWVGSNVTGYQLKTWLLVAETSNPNAAPAVTDSSATTGTCRDADFTDFTNGTNPDCKQFYDATGATHYRYASKTITAADTCTQYRSTAIPQPNCGNGNSGVWDSRLSACVFSAIPQEGRSCSASEVSCHEYRGPTASNVRLVFPVLTFGDSETGVSADTSPTGGFTPGSTSTESVSAFGHSLLTGPAPSTISKDISGKLTPGKQYTLSFWAKTATVASSGISASFTTTPAVSLGTVNNVKNDWQVYTLGPVQLGSTALPTSVNLVMSSPAQFYLDNVALREIGDTFFVRKGSWQTPTTCQASKDLRCAAYTDSTNTAVALTSFSKVCKLASVGCEALVDTQNSSSPQATTATAPGQSLTTPADTVVYRVYDPAKACTATAKACMRVGQPNLDAAGSVTDWSDKFVRLDPDTLDSANPASPLCARSQDMCEEFQDASGATHYFKDPGNGTCEYKQVDTLHGYDWYQKGSSELCNLLTNPSFEKFNDAGSNALALGDFETGAAGDPVPAPWATSSGSWAIATLEHYEGMRSAATTFAGGTDSLTQTFAATPGQTDTARAWVKASAHLRRTLRVTGCGVNVADYTEESGVWEKLQVTFTPTSRSCSLALTTTPGADSSGTAYYDSVSVNLADVFPGWQRNGGTGPSDPPLPTFTVHEPAAGQYWGGTVLEAQSTDQIYSGVWSDNVALTPLPKTRYFTMTAHVYVPDIPRNSNMLTWWFSPHATPATGCSTRPSTGKFTCNFSDFQPDSDYTVSPTDKGTWLTKHALLAVDPYVTTLSVGIYTNIGDATNTCTSATCRAGQVVYIDQVTLTEAVSAPAYSCPVDQVSCKAFRDPVLTKQTYYYLDNAKLDRTSCSGRVGEKDGCLLFTDLANPQLSWNAAATYAASDAKASTPVAPVASATNDSNTILKVSRDRVCSEWLACQSESTAFVNGKATSVCYALGRCNAWGKAGANSCGSWLNPAPNPVPLSSAVYQNRATDWSGQEYSGYAIPNVYPIDQLTQKNYSSNPARPDVRLTYINAAVKRCNGTGDPCNNQAVGSKCTDGTICQYEDKGLTGAGPLDASGALSTSATALKACRVYPEANSPFPDSVVKDWRPSCDQPGTASCDPQKTIGTIQLAKTKETGYKDAATCQPGEDCECFYQRASYTNGDTLFYGLSSTPAPRYAIDGSTAKLNRSDSLLGLRGYCLEKDTSRLVNGTGADSTNACLTWMPVDVVSGDVSIYDYAPEAGYQSPGGETYYCSLAAGSASYKVTASNTGRTIQTSYPCGGSGDTVCQTTNSVAGGVDNQVGFSLSTGDFDQAVGGTGAIAAMDIIVTLNGTTVTPGGMHLDRTTTAATWHWGSGQAPINKCNSIAGADYEHCGTASVDWSKVKPSDGAFITVAIYDPDSGGQHYSVAIQYYLSEVCTQSVQVSSGLSSKAWTNRVLGASGYQVEPTTDLGFVSNRSFSPYGRFIGTPSGLLVVSDQPGLGIAQGTTVSTPYACSGTCGGAAKPGMCLQGTLNGADTLGTACASSAECGTSGICTGYFSGTCRVSTPGQAAPACITAADCGPGGVCENYRSMAGNSATAGRSSVRKLFAKEYGSVQQWSGTAWTNGSAGQDVSGSTLGSLASNVPAAPALKQVVFDSVTKLASQGNGGFTLQTASGNFTSGNVVLSSPAPVTSLFYAYNPNGEQMPLTQVRVDWDTIKHTLPLSGAEGKYKNHKHLCESATTPMCIDSAHFGQPCTSDLQCAGNIKTCSDTGATCNSTSDCTSPATCNSVTSCDLNHANPRYTFGDATQACVDDSQGRQGYFAFTRVYTCSTSSANYDTALKACTFTPAVFVEDNWEWCANGTWGGACDPTSANSWVKFPGQVVVRP